MSKTRRGFLRAVSVVGIGAVTGCIETIRSYESEPTMEYETHVFDHTGRLTAESPTTSDDDPHATLLGKADLDRLRFDALRQGATAERVASAEAFVTETEFENETLLLVETGVRASCYHLQVDSVTSASDGVDLSASVVKRDEACLEREGVSSLFVRFSENVSSVTVTLTTADGEETTLSATDSGR